MRSRAVSLCVPVAALLALATLGTAASAAAAPAQTGTVAGKVMFLGKPLPGGTIAFHPAKGKPIKAKIKEDGSYEARKVPVGAVAVTIETQSLKPAPKKPGTPPAPGGKYVPIPPKYADPRTSALKLDVKKGKQLHNIELAE